MHTIHQIPVFIVALDENSTRKMADFIHNCQTGVTSFMRNDLLLQSGSTYYVSVRAIDLVENVSSIATSNGITVGQFSPTVTDPLDGSINRGY